MPSSFKFNRVLALPDLEPRCPAAELPVKHSQDASATLVDGAPPDHQVHLVTQDKMALLVFLANVALLESQESCPRTSRHTTLLPAAGPAPPATQDSQATPVVQDSPVTPAHQETQEALATPDHAAHQDQMETPERKDHQDPQEPTESQDAMPSAVEREHQENLDSQDSQAREDHVDPQDSQETADSPAAQESRDHLATTVPQDSQATPAHLDSPATQETMRSTARARVAPCSRRCSSSKRPMREAICNVRYLTL